MATKKETEMKFPKSQILTAKKFADNRDLVEALLDDKDYTLSEVEDKVKAYKKGKVN